MSGQFIAEFFDLLIADQDAEDAERTLKARIVELDDAGRFLDEIAQDVGFSQFVVRGILKALKRTPKRRARKHEKLPNADALRRHVAAGMTLDDIASRYGATKTAVSMAMRRHGITPNLRQPGRPRKLPGRGDLIALALAGVTAREIARRSQCAVGTVYQTLRQAGVERQDGQWMLVRGELTLDEQEWVESRARYEINNPALTYADMLGQIARGI